jgi:hypothetical protein
MSKQEIRQLATNYATKPGSFGKVSTDAFHIFVEVFEMAYNKALDDALELYYNPTSCEDQDTFDKDLESLKIK